jgi:hypothetical protein
MAAAQILVPAAPSLPIAPVDYSQQFTDQLSNVLRLYFTQLSNALGANVTSTTSVNVNNEGSIAFPAYLQTSRGLVSGAARADLFAYQAAIGTTFIPIWENTTAYPAYPTVAAVQYLWSSSGSDTAVQILVSGLDGSYNPISETVTLTGTTHKVTTLSYLRIQSIIVVGTVNPVGIVNIGPSATLTTTQYAEIIIGAGRSQMAIYTVPAGYTFYLTRVNIASNQVGNLSSSYCTYRVQTSSSAGIIATVLTTPFANNFGVTRVAPFPFAATTDLQFQANTPSSTANVGIQVEGILIANTAL